MIPRRPLSVRLLLLERAEVKWDPRHTVSAERWGTAYWQCSIRHLQPGGGCTSISMSKNSHPTCKMVHRCVHVHKLVLQSTCSPHSICCLGVSTHLWDILLISGMHCSSLDCGLQLNTTHMKFSGTTWYCISQVIFTFWQFTFLTWIR